MNHVPFKYRNVINPWQTPKEIKLAMKFIDQMTRKMTTDNILELLRTNQPDRNWA